MIESYSESQVKLIINTYIDTCSHEELLAFYDAFFREDFSDVEDCDDETIAEIDPAEAETIRWELGRFIEKDLEDDLRALSKTVVVDIRA